MAYFGFTDKLLKGEKIQIFNYGNCKRDFTYIDDIVEGVVVMSCREHQNVRMEKMACRFHLMQSTISVIRIRRICWIFVQILQEELIRAGVLPEDYDFEAHKGTCSPCRQEILPVTYADTSALERDYGYRPTTSLREGTETFCRVVCKVL